MGTVLKVPTSSGANSGPAPAGNHVAVCVGIYDIGTQINKYATSNDKQWQKKVILQWELTDEEKEDGQRYVISRFFTASLHEKAELRKLLVSWRGRDFTPEEFKGFDLKNLLGVPCMLNIVHKPKLDRPNDVTALVASATPLPKKMPKPEPLNTPVCWSIDDGGSPPDDTPDFIKNAIADSQERGGGKASNGSRPSNGSALPPANPPAEDEDSPPF